MVDYMAELMEVEDMEYSTLCGTIAYLEERLHAALRECAKRDHATISLTLIGHPDPSVELSRLRKVTKHAMSNTDRYLS
jgi:hypothetical protein